MANGHEIPSGRRRIVCDIDPEDFEAVAKAKLPGCKSMASKIRLLIEWGLIALEEEKPEGRRNAA